MRFSDFKDFLRSRLLLWFWFGFCRFGMEFLVAWCLEKASTGFTLSLAKETSWSTTFFLLNFFAELVRNWGKKYFLYQLFQDDLFDRNVSNRQFESGR